MAGTAAGLLIVPAAASAGTGPTAAAAATAAAGTARGWGYDFYGELGNGRTAEDYTTPVAVRLHAHIKVTAVSTSCSGGLALTTAGHVLSWGYNSDGQLGDGSFSNSDVPVNVRLPARTKVKAIGAGCNYGLALTSTGRVLAWGSDSAGQLGSTGPDSTTPVSVPMPHGDKIKAISAGCDFGLAITTTGRVLAWGNNAYGELGDGGTASSRGPVTVKLPGRTTVSSVSAGCNQGFAVTTTGGVLAWGLNSTGQLGDGSRKQADRPVKIRLPRGIKVISVSSGLDHTLAVTTTHHALAWGYGTDGELGDGTISSTDKPVRVRLPPRTTIRAVSAGYDYSLAVTTAGRAVAWGLNDIGQLGDATVSQRDVPVNVKLPAKVIAVAAAQAGSQSFAIMR